MSGDSPGGSSAAGAGVAFHGGTGAASGDAGGAAVGLALATSVGASDGVASGAGAGKSLAVARGTANGTSTCTGRATILPRLLHPAVFTLDVDSDYTYDITAEEDRRNYLMEIETRSYAITVEVL